VVDLKAHTGISSNRQTFSCLRFRGLAWGGRYTHPRRPVSSNLHPDSLACRGLVSGVDVAAGAAEAALAVPPGSGPPSGRNRQVLITMGMKKTQIAAAALAALTGSANAGGTADFKQSFDTVLCKGESEVEWESPDYGAFKPENKQVTVMITTPWKAGR
jgi:hypothetical protein